MMMMKSRVPAFWKRKRRERKRVTRGGKKDNEAYIYILIRHSLSFLLNLHT
jgi:hypothetical protein